METGGCAKMIHRTRNGSFSIDKAISLNDFMNMEKEEIKNRLIQYKS